MLQKIILFSADEGGAARLTWSDVDCYWRQLKITFFLSSARIRKSYPGLVMVSNECWRKTIAENHALRMAYRGRRREKLRKRAKWREESWFSKVCFFFGVQSWIRFSCTFAFFSPNLFTCQSSSWFTYGPTSPCTPTILPIVPPSRPSVTGAQISYPVWLSDFRNIRSVCAFAASPETKQSLNRQDQIRGAVAHLLSIGINSNFVLNID